MSDKSARRHQIIVCGAGGFGREIAWLVDSCSDSEAHYEVVCFVDDGAEQRGKVVNGIEVLEWERARQRWPDARVVVAIGTPQVRERVAARAEAAGVACATMIHPRVERSRWLEVGEGTVICAGNILTTNIRLGRHVQINLDCTIGHDVIMGDYATLAPGVHVSGCVHLGRRVYVGTGAVIINGDASIPLVVGDDAVIGAGACVIRSVPPGTTVVGVPAKEPGKKS